MDIPKPNKDIPNDIPIIRSRFTIQDLAMQDRGADAVSKGLKKVGSHSLHFLRATENATENATFQWWTPYNP